ncbi:hypothetical protein VKT23_002559 [Stygiomarasmius scandens]|uniref:Uncharacterized protein n=1 Tax=Marasmiellus scandens TaxID=2682957 RepID=A0ABR1K3I6_9AGAR
MNEMIKSLTDNDKFRTFIEAIPRSVYNSHQNKVWEQNAKLFTPLMYGSEQNIWSCIGQFAAKSEYWADGFQIQCAQACAQAIWALVQVYVTPAATVPEDSTGPKNVMDSVASADPAEQQKHFLQFAQSMPSLLKTLAASPDDLNELCSALMALGIQWIDMLDPLANIIEGQKHILEIFQAVSPYADKLEVSGAILDMILAALKHKYSSKVKNIISGNKKNARNIIQVVILAGYIEKFPNPDKTPPNFGEICNLIYPWSKPPFEVDGLDHIALSTVLQHSLKKLFPQTALKKCVEPASESSAPVDEKSEPAADVFFWFLRVIHSTIKPISLQTDESLFRQFVLQYFHKKHQDHPPALNAWKGEGLECIGQYVLKEMQNVNSEQFDICIDISIILLASASHSPNKREFYTGLFDILRTFSPFDAERKKKYLLLKTLLDLVVCIRLVPPSEFYEPLPKNSDSELATGEVAVPYLHWELSRLNTLDKASFRDTLAVAIVSRYIELRRKNELSPCDSVLKKLGYALSVKPKVEEDVQVMFAEKVSKLWQTDPKTESVKSTLLDVIGFVNCWGPFSSEWITSQPAAEILSGLNGLPELEQYDPRMKITVDPQVPKALLEISSDSLAANIHDGECDSDIRPQCFHTYLVQQQLCMYLPFLLVSFLVPSSHTRMP